MADPRSGSRAGSDSERDPRRALGEAGERRAAELLARAGYRIEARNVRAAGVEIDLVVRRGRLVVFVEVKTRRGPGAGRPEESLGPRQRARLVRAAAAWLREHGPVGARVRFDLVAVDWPPGREPILRHWPDAFDASG